MSDKKDPARNPQAVKRREPQSSPTRSGGPRVAWILPMLVLAAVVAVVWYFVFREGAEERASRLVQEGRTAMDIQDYVTAENRLREALRITPGNGVLLHNLGIVYLQLDRLPEARAAFEQAAMAHGPEANQLRAEELFQVATIAYREKDYSQAAEALERAIAADPTRVQLHARLLDLQLGRLENPTAAESTTARFLRLCGRTPENLGNAAFLYYQNEDFAGAAELSRRAVALQDSFVQDHAILARALWKSDRARDGLKSLEGPIARYPDAAPLWIARSLLLADTGARTEALTAADRAVALAPGEFEAHQARQKALALLGRYEDALREIDIARRLTQDPGHQRMLQTQESILRRMMVVSSGEGGAVDSSSNRTGP